MPHFEERTDILSSSIKAMDEQIHKTSTVQAHKCKTPITTYQQFSKKANNRQDQNSWKVSGQHFFVPYINVFTKFVKQVFIPIISNNNNTNNQQFKQEFIKLSGIIFALKLLTCKVKFERAKEKPLIRDRTLVLSGPLHIAFKKLHPSLNVPKFYLIEKAKRKKLKKKIVSADFHANVGEFCQYILEIQRKSILNPNFNMNNIGDNGMNIDNDIARNYDFPQDWIKNDDGINESKFDEDDDENDYGGDQQDEIINDNDDGDTLNTGHSGSVTYGDTDTIDTDLPPIVNSNNNNNNDNHINCMIIMDQEDEDDDDDDDDDNNTQYSSSTANSNNYNGNNNCNEVDIGFNYIHTNHNNSNNNSNNIGEYSSYCHNDNNNNMRTFQPMSNFANSNIGINKGGLSTDSMKRNYRNRESHIKRMRNNRFISSNNQYQQPMLKSQITTTTRTQQCYVEQHQQQRVEAHFPTIECISATATPLVSSNNNNNNNNKNRTTFTPPTTPSTPTITPSTPKITIPRYKRHNNNNIFNNNRDNNNNNNNDNNNTCNQSIINPLFIFNSTDINMNDDNNDINIGLGGFKLALPSPEQIVKVGSDTIMTGGIHTNEMGYSYNN